MPFDAETFFLFQPWQTDDLKAELETLRSTLRGKTAEYHDLTLKLEEANNTLSKMEEKADFVAAQVEQIVSLLTPPDPSDAERRSNDLDQYFSTPITMASGALAVGGLGALLFVGIAPSVLKVIGKAPKMGKAAKLAKVAKFTKVAKFAKITVVLGVALAVVEVVVQLATASQINAQLRKDRKTLEDAISEADDLLAEMRAVVSEAEMVAKDLLAEAGLGHLPPTQALARYVEQMNEAIAGLGRQKAVARMVRRMSLLGLAPEMIVEASQLDSELVADLIRKLEIERALVAGRARGEVAKAFDVTPEQVAAVEALVEARGAVLAGDPADAVSAATGVPLAVVSGEIDENLRRAAPHWGAIETGGDLADLTDPLLIHEDAIHRVRVELTCKTALAGGAEPAGLASGHGLNVEDVEAWAVALADARTQYAHIAEGGAPENPGEVAVSLRLPLGLVG